MDSASWQSVLIDSLRFVQSAMASSALGVRVLETGGGHRFLSCDSGCASVAHWSAVILDSGHVAGPPSIIVGPSGALYGVYGGWGQPVRYVTCPRDCLTLANWSVVTLDQRVPGYTVSVVLDASEEPWIAWAAGGGAEILHCSSGCGTAASWSATTLDSVPGADINMVIDSRGDPRIMESGFGVWYAQRPDTTVLIH